MSASNEEQIIKQYQPLVRALIPYEQENRLLEGLNKFTGRVPSHVRKIIKDEVIRLTCLTDAPADNSAFAQFPVFKFSHFGVEMRLDKVGATILQKESELYSDRYTVGVFESITSSAFYQEHIRKENHKKIVDAFTVETQSLDDIHFGDDIAISPNFPVSCPEFEKGKNCSVSSLGYKKMALESKRPPKVSTRDIFQFQFPEVPGLPKGMAINYVVSSIKFNKQTEKYETHFKIHPSTQPKIRQILSKYVDMAAYQQPLQRELEAERAMQDLERDRVLEHSPWVPVFLQKDNDGFKPASILFTKLNQAHSGGLPVIQTAMRVQMFPRLIRELCQYKEAFVITGVLETKKKSIPINATLREIESLDLLSPLIHLLNKNESLQCVQCRLEPVRQDDKTKAFAIHDLIKQDYPQLDAYSHIIYCKNVSETMQGLVLTEKRLIPDIPENLIDDLKDYSLSIIMEDELDRRAEARYLLDKEGSVKTGLLSSVVVKILDVSAQGMRLIYLDKPEKVGSEIRVTVPELKVKNQKYKVVNYHAASGEARLCLTSQRETIAAGITQFVQKHYAIFKHRDLSLIQRNTHRFVWELAMRHHPSASILCTTNRYLLNRLKTVYQSVNCDDLYPFSQIQNVVPMHGFFADRDAQKPKSKMLTDMLRGSITTTDVVHCVRKSDKKLVFVPEQEYLFSTTRKVVQKYIDDEQVELCVTKIEVGRCLSATTSMTKKRLAQLSRIDKAMYDKFNVMQSSYTHVIYLTSESVLQTAIMKAALRPVKQRTTSDLKAQG